MQAFRILTKFGSFRKKFWQWRKVAANKLDNLLVLLVPQSFYLCHFFQKYDFSAQFAKRKSTSLTSYFNTLTLKFSRFRMDFCKKNLKTFPPTDDISCHGNIRVKWLIEELINTPTIDELKFPNFFSKLRTSQKRKTRPKTHFLVFDGFVGNFSTNTIIIVWNFKNILFLRLFFQNDHSRSYSCLKLTFY